MDWLASGRSDKRVSVGYMFMFFYGLEYRFFAKKPDLEERLRIKAEVERLLSVYGERNSVRGYLGEFLEVAELEMDLPLRIAPIPSAPDSISYNSIRWAVALGRRIASRKPLSADWLLGWYLRTPGIPRLRTPARRAWSVFKEQFRILFDAKYPSGLKVPVPKQALNYEYQAASRSFTVTLKDLAGHVPDISGLRGPLEKAKEIVDEATHALDKYSRFIGRYPDSKGSIKAHILLPKQLRSIVACDEYDQLNAWVEALVNSQEWPTARALMAKVEGLATPPARINKKSLVGVADLLASMAVGFAPDPRFAVRSPRAEDPVYLFWLPQAVALDAVSDEYRAGLSIIGVGSIVAHADKEVSRRERGTIWSAVWPDELSQTERALALGNLEWALTVPPSRSNMAKLRKAPHIVRESIGHCALTVAISDGRIDSEEVRALEKLYDSLGLDTDDVQADLQALTTGTVLSPAMKEQGQLAGAQSFVLNQDRIEALRIETAQAAAVLTDVFADEDHDEEESSVPAESSLKGLEERYVPFLRALIKEPEWTKADLETLAKRSGLSLAAALPTVDDWCYDQFEDALLDMYEKQYEVNSDVIDSIKAVLQ